MLSAARGVTRLNQCCLEFSTCVSVVLEYIYVPALRLGWRWDMSASGCASTESKGSPVT